MNRAKYAENYDAVRWAHLEYRLIQWEHQWYVIRADEVPVFYRWCDAMAGKGEHVPDAFTLVRVEGPDGIVFREWREVEKPS